MELVFYLDDNLCSIAGIESQFGSNATLRELVRNLLSQASVVLGSVKRPYSFAIRPKVLGDKSATLGFRDLKHDDDWFSFSFEYVVESRKDLNNLIDLFLEVWFVYEHPVFSFVFAGPTALLQAGLYPECATSWIDITSRVPSVVFFKGTEDDVVWIGKSDELSFDLLGT